MTEYDVTLNNRHCTSQMHLRAISQLVSQSVSQSVNQLEINPFFCIYWKILIAVPLRVLCLIPSFFLSSFVAYAIGQSNTTHANNNNNNNTGHESNTTKQLNQTQISILHLIFIIYLLFKFCFIAWKKGFTPKIHILCFVIINSARFNKKIMCSDLILTMTLTFRMQSKLEVS